MATKKAQEQKTRTVQLELWSDWRSCGFAECELENLTADDLYDLCCNTDICGLDMGDLGGTLTVDGEDVSIDFSQIALEYEGVATGWDKYIDTCGVYFIEVDKTAQYAEFEIEGDFDPNKLTFYYRTAIHPGHKRLKILTYVAYDDEILDMEEPDEFDSKDCEYWVFANNKYSELFSSEDIEGFQPEDCDWKQFPAEFIYAIENGGVVVKGIRKGFQGDLSIPSTISGMPVTSIRAGAFKDYSGLTSVTIPDGVTSIGDKAFADCEWLTKVTIPQGAEVGENAFDGHVIIERR